MNTGRTAANGKRIDEEPDAQQIYITSAGSKTSFAYERLIELLIDECITPEDIFVCGAGYELPLHYGLFNKKAIQDQKMSKSFNADGFARESMSINYRWTLKLFNCWNLLKLNKLQRELVCA